MRASSGNANTGSREVRQQRARVQPGRGGHEVEHDPEHDRPQHAAPRDLAGPSRRTRAARSPGSTSVESAITYQTKIAAGRIAAVPHPVRGRHARQQERQPAVLREQEAEHHHEAAVHEHELHLVGEHDRAQAAAVDVEHRQHRGRDHARHERRAEHGGEQRAEHEHVRRRRGLHEHRPARPPAPGRGRSARAAGRAACRARASRARRANSTANSSAPM